MKSDKISRLVTENINLIYLVMKRFRNRGVEQEDLFQIGAVGLTKAAQRFDEAKGFAFSTYAVPLIIGEIQRFLRDDGMVHISRKIQDDARKIAIIREKYKMSENSEISLEKLENISGISKQDIIIAMEADKKTSSIENESVLDFLDNKMSAEASGKASETDKVINHIAMQQAFDSLDDSERRLIILRYMQDKTQKQVAEVLGRNQVAISRMEKNVLHLSILHRAVRRLQSVDGPVGNHLPCRVALGDAALGGRVEILPVVLVLHLPVGILVHGVLIVVGTGGEAQHACQQGQQGEQVFECLHLMLLCKIRPATPLPNQ